MQPFLDRDLRIAPIDVWIDPPEPKPRAIITHGHGDHARSGHGAVLATPDTIAIMKARYGEDSAGRFQALDYGVPLDVGGVTVSSATLAAIVGSGSLTRAELTKKIWAYIKRNGLQDSKNRRNINADDKLKPVFGGKSVVNMFEMTKLVNKHLS